MIVIEFIDSSVVTLAFTNNEQKEACRNEIRKGGVTNSLVLVESFVNIERITKSRNLAKDAVKSLLAALVIVPVDNNVIFEALKRAEKCNLKFFDLVHYTTALLRGCSSIISYDRDFDNLEIKRKIP